MSRTDDPRPVVYSTNNPSALINIALDKLGSTDAVIAILTPPNNCSYKTARQIANEYSKYLGISEAEFMKRWKAMR